MANNEQKWLRKTSPVEAMFEMISSQEILLVCYKISVSSSSPLSEHQVKEALSHLYRKTPNLRVCMGDHNGGRWFREMDAENIDFQVVHDGDVKAAVQELHTCLYDTSNGPLWRLRLVPVPNPTFEPARFSDFCVELHSSFPHSYHLCFGFHHSMGDGNSYKKIIGAFIAILDDVLSGKTVSDHDQIGKFELNEEFDKKMTEQESKIGKDETIQQKYIEASKKGQPAKPFLDQILPPPGSGGKTIPESQTFDAETTRKLIQQSKVEKVSVNSSFAAICNLAFADILHEKGIKQDSYAISNTHIINTRRFWEPSVAAENLGCYIGMSLRQFVETPRAMNKDDFWMYAKEVHQGIYQLLKSEDVLQDLAFVNWTMTKFASHNDRELTYNTMGDVSSVFANRRNLQVTHFVNTSSIHNTNMAWDHIMCSIKGRFIHTIKYNSNMVNKELVTRYMDLIYKRVQEITS